MLAPANLLPILAPIAGGVAVLAWRVQETRAPVSVRTLVLPPLGMATGLLMFVSPRMRLPWPLALGAFLFGALVLSWPLARSSTLERQGDVVTMRRSRGFLVILLTLLAIRLALHEWIGHLLPPGRTAALFFLLAFGMILRWRVGLLRRYRGLMDEGAPRAD